MAPTLKAQLESACSELATLRKAHTNLIDDNSALKISLRGAEEEITHLRKDIEARGKDLEAAKTDMNALIETNEGHAQEMITLRENLQNLLEDKNKIITNQQNEIIGFKMVITKERENHEETRIHLSEWIERTKRHEYWLSLTEQQYQRSQKKCGALEIELQELREASARPIRYIYTRLSGKVDKEYVYVGANPREDPDTFMQAAE